MLVIKCLFVQSYLSWNYFNVLIPLCRLPSNFALFLCSLFEVLYYANEILDVEV